MLTNSQHDAIMRRYSLIQADEQRALSLRREQAYAKIPRLRSLDEEAGRAALARAKQLISEENASGKEAFEQTLSDISRRRRGLLKENGFPEDFLELRYHCPICRDTGYVDGERCSCFKQMAIELVFDDPGLSRELDLHNFGRFSFECYSSKPDAAAGISPRENMHRIVSAARNFIDGFDKAPGYLLFYGKTGLGKTFLSHCIAKELLDSGHLVIYQTAVSLFERMAKDTFSREESSGEDSHLFLTCDLLIIDDLGTELVNSFVAGALFTLLNERIRHGKSTIISTNLSLEQIESLYSERVSSRIASGFELMHFFGEDIRLEQRILMSGGLNGQSTRDRE